jgi:hypothetical protein
LIDGVEVRPLRQILDERGKIMHMLRRDDPWFVDFGTPLHSGATTRGSDRIPFSPPGRSRLDSTATADRDCWVPRDEIEKLLRRGEGVPLLEECMAHGVEAILRGLRRRSA